MGHPLGLLNSEQDINSVEVPKRMCTFNNVHIDLPQRLGPRGLKMLNGGKKAKEVNTRMKSHRILVKIAKTLLVGYKEGGISGTNTDQPDPERFVSKVWQCEEDDEEDDEEDEPSDDKSFSESAYSDHLSVDSTPRIPILNSNQLDSFETFKSISPINHIDTSPKLKPSSGPKLRTSNGSSLKLSSDSLNKRDFCNFELDELTSGVA